MGFQLVIAEGKEAGREFVFDQTSVLIGRTSECDVVLYDPGVSRKHCRIFSEAEGYFVEDMGSSNGTKVNGSPIKKKQLADGDALSLGPVVFNFAAVVIDADPATDSGTGEEGQGPHTRIVSAAEVKRSRNKGIAMVPEGAGEDKLKEIARTSTKTMQAVAKPRSSNGALVKQSGEASQVPAPSSRRSNPGGATPLSAAERARLKRKSGAAGGLKIMWAEGSTAKKAMMASAVGIFALGVLGGLAYAFWPKPNRNEHQIEPVALSASPIEMSFGLGTDGEPVTWERPDQKVFDFEFKAPVKAVVVLHYQAKDISSGEVVIYVNGAEIAQVPPDTLGVNERQLEVLIKPEILKKGETNKVVFDNVKNPPGADPWRIWNPWVEVALLPELPPEQLKQEASNEYMKGMKMWEQREIGAGNTWSAYKAFRETWLMLESHPDPKPSTYNLARDKMKDAAQELDRLCNKLLLGAQTSYNQKRFEEARNELEHINEFFPERKHPCPSRSDQLRAQWDI